MRIVSLVAITLAVLSLRAQNPATTPPDPDWVEFRKSYPLHVQGVALAEPQPDGSRTLIIAEPPPHTTVESLMEAAPELGKLSMAQHRVGFDGYVRDAVARLPAMNDEQLHDLLVRLHVEMFDSGYKAYWTPFKPTMSSSQAQLDLRVTAADLQRWLLAGQGTFIVPGRKLGVTLPVLLAGDMSGVFFSSNPGLVAWVLPKGVDVARVRRHTRRFVLDSDLIIGSISSASQVAIIGRERVVPFEQLAPLRVESIELLAAASTDHLAQSYERRYFAAGRFTDRDDWAPIYLSDVLIDTEIGSLLNIADQLLKGWSENGRVSYINFPYAKPRKWPFAKPLSDLVHAEAGPNANIGVTYNWNTDGAGYKVDFPRNSVMALNRTGALPVSYLPSGGGHAVKYESDGYRYFAATQDPHLVRVVQYTALYQTFRRGGWSGPSAQVTPELPPDSRMARLARGELGILLGSKWRDVYKDETDAITALTEAQTAVLRLQKQWSVGAVDDLSRVIASPIKDEDVVRRMYAVAKYDGQSRAAYLRDLNEGASSISRSMRYLFTPELRLKALRSFEGPAQDGDTWIRTPRVVISRYASGMLVGGHNWDAEIVSLKADITVPKGAPRVVAEGGRARVLVHPDDIGGASHLLRTINSARSTTQLEAQLASALPAQPNLGVRTWREALLLPERSGGGRGWEPPLPPGGSNTAGAIGPDRGIRAFTPAEQREWAQVGSLPYLRINRSADGYVVFDSFAQQKMEFKHFSAAVDEVIGRSVDYGGVQSRPVHYQVAGFSAGERSAFLTSIETGVNRQTSRGYLRPTNASSVIAREGVTPGQIAGKLNSHATFATAKLGTVQALPPIKGAGPVFEAPLQITTIAQRPGSLGLRIRLFYAEHAKPSVTRARDAITGAMAKLNRPSTVSDAIGRIRKEMRAVDPDLRRVEFEADEFLMAARPSERPSRSRDENVVEVALGAIRPGNTRRPAA